MPERIFPPRWRLGDRIALVAPAFHYDAGRVGQGLEILRGWGLSPTVPEDLATREGYFAGSDEHRLRLLREGLLDPAVNGVFCARGGYGAMRLLPGLPYERLVQSPRLLVGFSDITALSLALFAKSGLVSVHGPMAGSLSWDEGSSERLRRILRGEAPGQMTLPHPRVFASGRAEGVLLGGNLCLVASLAGTPYLPSLRGAILYLEEIDEKPYRIDRMLTQLMLSGALDGLAGVLVGDFLGCEDPQHPSPVWDEVLERRLGGLGVPVLGGFPGGHGRVNWPLLIGAQAEIDTQTRSVTIKESLV